MNLYISLVLLSVCSVGGFLNFPPSGDNAVATFMEIIRMKRTHSESDFMKNAIRGEICNRKCRFNDRRVCHFKFMIKYYQVMSG